MAIVNVTVLLEEQLKCGKCDGVILKIADPALLLINQGVPVEDIKSFIRGSVVEFTEVFAPGTCTLINFQYIISYDDALLLDPLVPLKACDIALVCCADCVIDYIDELDFDHVLSSPDCGTVRLTRPDATFDDVLVPTCVSLPITGTGVPLDPLDIFISTDPGNILSLGGDLGLFGSAHLIETITTLVDNLNNSFTYTSEDATGTTVPFGHTLTEPVPNTARLTRPDGTFDDIIITGTPETVTTLIDNGNTSFTYTNEVSAVTNFNAAHTLSEPVANTVRLTRPDATFDDVIISETITTLVDNGNNTFTYTSEDATGTIFDAEHDLTRPNGTTFRLTRPDATFQEVTVTDTTTIGSVGFQETVGLPYAFNNASPFVSSIAGPLIIAGEALRSVICEIDIAFRPSFIYRSNQNSVITVLIEVSIDLAAFVAVTTQQYRYDLPLNTLIQVPVLHNERQFYTIPAGGNINIRTRYTITATNTVTSTLDDLNGSISAKCNTV